MAVGMRVMSGMTKSEIDAVNAKLEASLNTDKMFTIKNEEIIFDPNWKNCSVYDSRIRSTSCADVTFHNINDVAGTGLIADTNNGYIDFTLESLPTGKWVNSYGGLVPCACRFGKAVVDDAGRVHVTNALCEYYIKTESSDWYQIDNAPTLGKYNSMVKDTLGGVNILGGYDAVGDGGSDISITHYRYDVYNDQWEICSNLPYAFYHGCSVLYDNKIHILGSADSSSSTKHFKLDVSTSSWTEVSTLPYEFSQGSVYVDTENVLHILGGKNNTRKHYKLVDNTWVSVETLPMEVCGSFVTLDTDGNLHVIGGEEGLFQHWIYKDKTWVQLEMRLPYYFNNDIGYVTLDGDIVTLLEAYYEENSLDVPCYEYTYRYSATCNILITNV